jgi:ATP-dependent protease ClpP protease subunit
MKTFISILAVLFMISPLWADPYDFSGEAGDGYKIPTHFNNIDELGSVDCDDYVEQCGDGISRTMVVQSYEGDLSGLSFVYGERAYTKIFGGLSTSDVTRLWNDLIVIREKTDAKELNVFINSGGGDAFSGLALADELKRAHRAGLDVVCHASGIVASAAVPIFAVCDTRIAAPGTIFMVHETSLWKWPGRESASDIRSQGELIELLRDQYLGILADHSKLSKDQWGEMEGETTWFCPKQALEWGLVDKIE